MKFNVIFLIIKNIKNQGLYYFLVFESTFRI
jgi:hypothetical protein